jgi:hypothetical protein
MDSTFLSFSGQLDIIIILQLETTNELVSALQPTGQ